MATDAPPFRVGVSTFTFAGQDWSEYIRRVRYLENVAENDIPTLAKPGAQDVGTIQHRLELTFFMSFDIDAGPEGLMEKLQAAKDPTTFQQCVYTPVAGVTFTANAKLAYVPSGEYDPGENVEFSINMPLDAEPVYANTATPAP